MPRWTPALEPNLSISFQYHREDDDCEFQTQSVDTEYRNFLKKKPHHSCKLRLPEKIEEDPKVFRSYTNIFKRSKRDKRSIFKNDIFICDIISFLSVYYHSVYHRLLNNNIEYPLVIWIFRIEWCNRPFPRSLVFLFQNEALHAVSSLCKSKS